MVVIKVVFLPLLNSARSDGITAQQAGAKMTSRMTSTLWCCLVLHSGVVNSVPFVIEDSISRQVPYLDVDIDKILAV